MRGVDREAREHEHPELSREEPEAERVVRPTDTPLLSRSMPVGMPVFDGAMNAYGYVIGSAPFCDNSRKLWRKRSAATGSKSNSLIRRTSGRVRCTTSALFFACRTNTVSALGSARSDASLPSVARLRDRLNVAKRASAAFGFACAVVTAAAVIGTAIAARPRSISRFISLPSSGRGDAKQGAAADGVRACEQSVAVRRRAGAWPSTFRFSCPHPPFPNPHHRVTERCALRAQRAFSPSPRSSPGRRRCRRRAADRAGTRRTSPRARAP